MNNNLPKNKTPFEQDYINALALVRNTNPNQNLVDAFNDLLEGQKAYEEHSKMVGR